MNDPSGDAGRRDEPRPASGDDDGIAPRPEPTKTSHPVGETQAAANAENEPPG